MVEGFQSINTTITIRDKKTFTDSVLTAEVFNFKESGVSRKVEFKKIVGGRVLPKISNPESYTVSFDFILIDGVLEGLTSAGNWYFDEADDDKNLYMVQLNFSNSSGETYTKRYYDAYITEFKIEPKDEILEGMIRFTLPSISINGNETIYMNTNLATADTYNNTMGYVPETP